MPPTPPTPTPTPTPMPTFSFHHNRPAIPSPLSSPIRTASSPPPQQQQQRQQCSPLSPCHPQRGTTQSSPIFPSTNTTGSSCGSKFRFATRNPRPNPALKRREDAQEGRRRLFLQNVRQRADEKRWERRGGEDEVEELEQERQEGEGMRRDVDMDVDALMVDDIEQQEEAELEALVSTWEGAGPKTSSSPHFSDDEDYDGLFMDLISQQQQQQWQLQDGAGSNHWQDVEMS
ncbi:hypothetical protein MMYC01_200316 [Madurella mycetomatis]|uniref:Uncharacterized protein n=1 Tax=Madurella mycetomatis TaxID=100816 RepID=A0A175WJS9_9PEZI|nr:hypothetical protein MMYC01_201154 [Madurella mycetomatis]KXX83104.1 hypothetical protein MMYC01_200316 [Madurella mycetomatis]